MSDLIEILKTTFPNTGICNNSDPTLFIRAGYVLDSRRVNPEILKEIRPMTVRVFICEKPEGPRNRW